MRIAIFCHKFWPAVGGLCTYTGRLAEYLVDRQHDVLVFTTKSPPDSAAREQVAPKLLVRRFETVLGSHPPYYFMPALLKMAASSEFRSLDVVHSVGYYFFGTVFGHALAKAHGVPHISTPVYTLNPSNWQRRTFDHVMGRRIVRNADHVIPQSEHERGLLRAGGFEVKSSTIVPFGVDSQLFDQDYDVEDLRSRHSLAGDEKVLLYIGKVMSPKGAFDCLEMLARLRTRGRKVRMIVIGDVHERERESFSARIRALDLDTAIVSLGPLNDRREIARYYQLADVVLFPSQYEQFGIVALEAAASGRPLLGTPVGIMQTLVPQYEFGLLHAFGDVDAFTRNTNEVLDVPSYRANATQHRREILSRYDWRAISADTERIYEQAVRDGPVIEGANRPFGKYERFGAYHWREVEHLPTRHNAVLTARYRVLLDAMDAGARRVLDIGCGDGTLTYRLAERAETVCGVDDSLLPLRLARGEFNRRSARRRPLLTNGDARLLPFRDEAFDCVVMADVIEHIDTPDAVMSEAHRLLRKGGQILLTTPRRQGAAAAHEYHCHEYTGAELAALLRQRFTGVQVRPFQPIRAARLYQRKVLGRKLFKIAINCCAIAGWNPLARTADASEEAGHTDLCAWGHKP